MKIPGIPGLPTDRQAATKSKEAVLLGADRSTPTGEIDPMCGTSMVPSSGPVWLGPVLDRFSKMTRADLEKMMRATEADVSQAGIEVGPLDEEEGSPQERVHSKTLPVDLESLRPTSHPSMQAYYDARQGTINFWSLSGYEGLPGAELLLPGAELLPIEPPQAPVRALGGPFEWDWNLSTKPERSGPNGDWGPPESGGACLIHLSRAAPDVG